MRSEAAPGRFARSYVATLLAVAVGGVLVWLLVCWILRSWEQDRVETRFLHEANIIVSSVAQTAAESTGRIESIAAFYAASSQVTRTEFRVFVRSFFKRDSGLQALSWLPRVRHQERNAYEEAARQEGLSGFQIAERRGPGEMVRAATRQEYFPVYFIEPSEGNEEAIGYDVASQPRRLEAMNRARDSGEPRATAPIKLVQEREQQMSFLILWPVYRDGAPIDTVVARRDNLKGFISGVFRSGTVLETAFQRSGVQGIDVCMFDTTGAGEAELLSCRGSALQPAEVGVRAGQLANAFSDVLHHRATIDLPGREWTILLRPTPEYLARITRWLSSVVLLVGFVLTGLLVAHLNQRRRVARAIEASEQRYRALVETMNEGLARTDEHGLITYTNPCFCEMLGYSPEELLGRSAEDFIDAGSRQRYLDQIPARERGERATYEIALRKKNGQLLTVLLAARPIITDAGEFGGSLAVFTDITQRKRIEIELLRANDELQAMFDAYPDMSFRLAADGTVLDYRASASSYMYLGPEEFLGKKGYELLPPPGNELLRGAIEELQRTGSGVTVEYPVPRAAGEETHEARLSPLPGGEILVIVRDVTERKEAVEALARSEERFRTLVETMNEGLGIADEHGIVTYANPGLCRMLGFSEEELVGHPGDNFFDEESRQRYLAGEPDRRRGLTCSFELLLRKKNGQPVPTLVSQKGVLDEDGVYRGNMGIVTNISKQKMAEEQLEALSMQLLRVQDAERQRIAHELHDDFGQTLAVAKIAARRLHGKLPAGQFALKELAEQLCQHLESSIAKMRRLQHGLHPTVLEHLGLAEAIETLVGDFQEGTGIVCNLDTDDPLPSLDRERELNLYRIVQEALTNIARHADATEVDVVLHANASHLRVEVRDDGRGIDPQRTVAATSYGLTGMRKRAQHCGGRLDIRAEPGEGTALTVELPI